MFERFTDRARRVVVLAQEESRMLNHNYVGTEHILLGLVHEGEGVAAQALQGLGVSLEEVRRRVEEIIGEGDRRPTGHIPFTSRAKRVLELSLRESVQLGQKYIGTEHILLGLIAEGEGVAAQVMQQMGVDLDRARAAVIQFVSGYAPSAVAAEAFGRAAGGVVPTPGDIEPASHEGARCPSCRASLAEAAAIATVTAADDEGEASLIRVLYCRACSAALGPVP
jgi:ATP-dependent Clp protease ATP-binding subunit ClpC